jgi:hypothetical protein
MERTTEQPTADNAPYGPMGVFRDFMGCRDAVVVLEGPAGTGKSRAAFEKIHRALEKYAGARVLYVRNTRKSCTDSGLVTFEEHVLPRGHYLKSGAKRDQRHSYRYANGSELVVGGLDEPTKLFSTEYDMVFVQEVNECTEDQVAPLRRCMRNGKMPYQQIIADLNPTITTFWLYQWELSGEATVLKSRHEDNPTLTPEYLRGLSSLRGAWRDSLFLGLRVANVDGAYFGQDVYQATEQGRVREMVPVDRHLDVHTAWDLGLAGGSGLSSGFMAIWFFQVLGNEWRWVKYLEGAGEGIEYYAKEIRKWQDEHNVTLGTTLFPHDGEAKDMFTGKSRKEAMESLKFKVQVVARYDFDDAVMQTSDVIGRSFFSRPNAGTGVQRLSFFRREKDPKTGMFTGRYRHDEASHGASAFMTAVMGYSPPAPKRTPDKPSRYGDEYGAPGGSVY